MRSEMDQVLIPSVSLPLRFDLLGEGGSVGTSEPSFAAGGSIVSGSAPYEPANPGLPSESA
jgi:hypothetical protein